MGCIASKKAGGFPKIERKPFQDTEIFGEIDDLFKTVQAPLDTLCDISEALSTANESIQKLTDIDEVKKQLEGVGSEIKDILKLVLEDLKKNEVSIKVEVADDFSSIDVKLEVKTEGSYIGECVKAIMDLVEAIKTLFEKVPEIVENMKEVMEKAKEWGNMDKLKEEAAKLDPPPGAMALMKCGKAIGNNTKSLGGVVGDVEGLVSAVKELAGTLKDAASWVNGLKSRVQ